MLFYGRDLWHNYTSLFDYRCQQILVLPNNTIGVRIQSTRMPLEYKDMNLLRLIKLLSQPNASWTRNSETFSCCEYTCMSNEVSLELILQMIKRSVMHCSNLKWCVIEYLGEKLRWWLFHKWKQRRKWSRNTAITLTSSFLVYCTLHASSQGALMGNMPGTKWKPPSVVNW